MWLPREEWPKIADALVVTRMIGELSSVKRLDKVRKGTPSRNAMHVSSRQGTEYVPNYLSLKMLANTQYAETE